MNQHRLAVRAGAGAVAFALILRLLGTTGFTPMAAMLQRTDVLSFLIYLQTGRLVSTALQPEEPSSAETQPTEPEPSAPRESQAGQTQPDPIRQEVFSPSDLQNISVSYGCDYRPDLENLLLTGISWNLTAQEPTVLIVHTHATECYTPAEGETYDQSGSYRTLEETYNMVSIGDEIARVLQEGGICVLHDRTYHDYPSYNSAYASSRASVEAYLEQYPSIRLVLDIHRDASGGENQLTTWATVDGEASSQLMLVVGTHSPEAPHENWQQNLSLALKLHALLQRENPGICRPVNLRDWRFNQDLSAGSLLVEVGAAGDSHQQALTAARALAEGILALARGAATADSTI
ncbi:MAG: stage II sporulation protein P [Faecousia sp.]